MLIDGAQPLTQRVSWRFQFRNMLKSCFRFQVGARDRKHSLNSAGTGGDYAANSFDASGKDNYILIGSDKMKPVRKGIRDAEICVHGL